MNSILILKTFFLFSKSTTFLGADNLFIKSFMFTFDKKNNMTISNKVILIFNKKTQTILEVMHYQDFFLEKFFKIFKLSIS